MATYDKTKVDDAAYTPATDSVYPMGAMADEAATDSVDEGDVGALRMTVDRKLLTRVVGSTDTNRLEVDSSGRVNVATIATSITPGTAAANLGKAEDAAHASGDTGVAAWGVRNDSGATTFGANGDYTPIATDANGRIGVTDLGVNIGVSVSNEPTVFLKQYVSTDTGDDIGKSTATPFDPTDHNIAVMGVNAGAADGSDPTGYDHIGTDGRKRLWMVPGFDTRSDTHSGAGNGTTVDTSTHPSKYFSLQVTQTGGVTVWEVRLEVSLDNVTFTTVITHTNTDLTGITKALTTPFPVLYFRSRCVTKTGGTSLTAVIVGMN